MDPSRPKPKLCTLSDEEYEALCQQVSGSTRALFDVDARTFLGTGTPVRVGQRSFIATAAHVIPDGRPLGILRRESEPEIPTNFQACHKDRGKDLCALELSAEQTEILGDLPGPQRMLLDVDQGRAQSVVLVGFPKDAMVKLTPSVTMRAASTVQAQILLETEWPSGLEECQKGRDLFLPYPKETYCQITGPGIPYASDRKQPRLSLDPHGMSGGGVWLLAAWQTDSGPWYPASRLVAVQVTWYEKSELLRAVVLRHWVDLVSQHNPDLEDALDTVESWGPS